jgi:ATP-dependent Clp protease ATP-binding subunit ClpC
MKKMEDYNLVPRAKKVLELSVDIATKNKHQKVNCAHILCAALEITSIHVKGIFDHFQINIENLKKSLTIEFPLKNPSYFKREKNESQWSKDFSQVLENAKDLSLELEQHFIGLEHVIYCILTNSEDTVNFLEFKGIKTSELAETILSILESKEDAESQKPKDKNIKNEEIVEKFTSKYCHNLNEFVETNSSKIESRDLEINKLIEILSCKIKNNAILVGDPGTGKTAIVEGLAQRINSLNCPVYFSGFKIYSLDLGLMVAGTKYRGQFEERFKGLIEELRKDSQAILFIDEIHSIVGAGSSEGTLDLANMIKPALARGEIKCIGATTHAEYKKYFEKDAALNRRFQLISIEEPSKKQTFEILKKAKQSYEVFHGVTYNDSIISNIIELADKYLPYRRFPDKAFDILDRIGASGKMEKFKIPTYLKEQETNIFSFVEKEDMEKKKNKDKCEKMLSNFLNERNDWLQKTNDLLLEVKEEHLIDVISKVSGLDKSKIEPKNKSFLSIKQEIESKVFDQSDAIDKIYNVLLCAKAGIKTTKKTLANFLFVGSTGVGKTYTAKVIAEKFYNKPNSFLQIDMAEYIEKNSISKLLGTSAGYVGYEEGGMLSEFVRNNPNSLILFDEVEKAHPEVVNILLKIMDEGVITDNFNRKIDFSNAIIVMTGNIGAEFETARSMGFIENKTSQVRNVEYTNSVKKQFKPELISRIDEILIFNNKFSKEGMNKMIQNSINEIEKSLSEKNIILNCQDQAKEFLYNLILEESSNARAIQKILRNKFELPLCEFIVSNENISEISIKLIDNTLVFC